MTSKRKRFNKHFPDAFFLDRNDITGLQKYLRQKGCLVGTEHLLKTDNAGEGNMNLVLKVDTNQREFIVKQARPWVEKYPDIDAPIDRIYVEATYYAWHKQDRGLQKFVPDILDYDAKNFILFLEYLGTNRDATYLYKQGNRLLQQEADHLVSYINRLHNTSFKEVANPFPDNSKLKKLNHQHIFVYPYLEKNGLDLDSIQPGLQETAMPYIRDQNFTKRVTKLGDVYLGDGPCLLHGDYYPGSWIKTSEGFKVIDPEFAHYGQPEFDIGVMIAHMYLAQQPDEMIQKMFYRFKKRQWIDFKLAVSFVGIEIIRRLIGLAQLSPDLTLDQKNTLLKQSYSMISSPSNYI